MKQIEKLAPVHYKGEIVDAYKKRIYGKTHQVQLIQFIKHGINTVKNKDYILKLYNEDSKLYYVEIWEAMDVSKQIIQEYRIPVVIGKKVANRTIMEEESSLQDRKPGDYVNDLEEVNLLIDSYDSYLNNRRELNSKGFYKLSTSLLLQRQKHEDRLTRLRELVEQEPPSSYKEGLTLHLIQRESPTALGKRLYERWCLDNPRLFTKLKQNVYIINNNVST